MTPYFSLFLTKRPLFSVFSLSPKDPYFGGRVRTYPSLLYVSAPGLRTCLHQDPIQCMTPGKHGPVTGAPWQEENGVDVLHNYLLQVCGLRTIIISKSFVLVSKVIKNKTKQNKNRNKNKTKTKQTKTKQTKTLLATIFTITSVASL